MRQTYPALEIIVVSDAAEPLNLPEDKNIRVFLVGPKAGGNVARQRGIVEARGQLVALLDDDDEWLPNHLEEHIRSVAHAVADGDDEWISSSAVLARRAGSDEVWPDRFKGPGETLAQYIFRKHSVRGGVGFMQASTLLFPRQLAIRVPFNPLFKFHQDVGWLNDVSAGNKVTVIQPRVPTVVHNIGNGVARSITGEKSIGWARENLDPRDLRTIGDFIAVHSMQAAKNERSVRAMCETFRAARRWGRPGLAATIFSLGLIAHQLVSALPSWGQSRP